jgi:hypothetical protein
MARYNEAKASFWKAADDYREFAYLFLQEQQSLFPDWVNSPSYTIYSGLFFRSNTEIREYVGMVSSVSTFLAIKTNIKLAEDRYILPLVSAAQAEQLKKANRENVLTAQEAMLLDKIKSALGWLALYESAPGLRAVIEDGVLFTALPPEKNLAQIMSKEDVEVYRADAFIKGNMYLSQLKEFLDQNAAAYPLYFNSPQYQLRKEEYSLPQNRGKKSFGLY